MFLEYRFFEVIYTQRIVITTDASIYQTMEIAIRVAPSPRRSSPAPRGCAGSGPDPGPGGRA